ncbi:MAG: DNA methylase [Bacteroidaceae bacterium]
MTFDRGQNVEEVEASRTYISIDLKTFFASVECVERGLDPLTTNLLVADVSRTEKTICLAVSSSLKSYGIGGRARLFEVIQRLREVNNERRYKTPFHRLTGKSWKDEELKAHEDWEVDYIVAPPRMAKYIEYSTRIYQIYLKYIAPEDIHVYSIDEVFMDVTTYLDTYRMTAHELAVTMIRDILKNTGITATAGIGTNLYLCKIAMDIMAKKAPADKDGVRIAELDERSYREQLWDYTPISKFWRVGKGIAEKLAMYGMHTMGDVALCSVEREGLLYKLFGVNAELLIDHAWGWEPVTMEYVKAYKPETNSLCSGQVLSEPYTFRKARVVVQEMADAVALDLVSKRLVTDQLVLTIGYDTESLTNPLIRAKYEGAVTTDHYGRQVPKQAHGTANLGRHTSSTKQIMETVASLYDRIVNPHLLVRRLTLATNHVISEENARNSDAVAVQLDLFTDYEALKRQKKAEADAQAKERRMQETLLSIKNKFGKNSILRGLNFEEGATAIERNKQIGGHKA